MMSFNRLNNLGGWLAFAVAFIVYILTVAPTASFWDCGEFIAVSNELQVSHPPGAPMYMLLARMFAIFAPGPESVAYMINLFSVVCSAFMVLFTFWIVTALGRKMLGKDAVDESGELKPWAAIGLVLAGLTGAFAAGFTDSVWFNAVEAEVYAGSSVFTALVVWLMLKWERRADEPDHLKWILLITYLMGVSIGVHLLNLLALPALALLYYFRKFPFKWGTFAIALGLSLVILGFINSFVIKTTFEIAYGFEKFFTGVYDLTDGDMSGLGLPFGTGTAIFFFLMFGTLIGALIWSIRNQHTVVNMLSLGIILVYIGLSSYMVIYIRANAEPPINENAPSNMLTFIQYMKREQYGSWPIFWGREYHAQPTGYDQDNINESFYVFRNPEALNPAALGVKAGDRDKLTQHYVLYSKSPEYEYRNHPKRFFPRMHSSSHYQGKGYYSYINWVSDKGPNPRDPKDDNPSGLDHIKYFFAYQLNHMYIRYFMWNFVGREGDVQHEIEGWEDGLFLDSSRGLPEYYQDHPARNHYYALPLLLGLVGLFFQAERSRRGFFFMLLLFALTGFAIIMYLNQPPMQPRERDYSFAGSFQTFAIWIGLGALAVIEGIRGLLKKQDMMAAVLGGVLCLVAVPGLMLAENWDDHTRAGRYIAPDSARNLLNSCAPNAILFTNGDNDTFPLWYLQEVEGVRTDVRVVNLSLLNTDWYIHQLKQSYNDALPVPLSVDETFYMGDKNAVKVLSKDQAPGGKRQEVLPVLKAASQQALLANGAIMPQDTADLQQEVVWDIRCRPYGGQYMLMKQDLMIVDLIRKVAADGWKRPVYFAISIPDDNFVGLDSKFFRLEGMAFRVVPVADQGRALERVNTEVMYENVMNKFQFRNLDNPNVWYDHVIRRMVGNFRSNYVRLASSLAEEASNLEAQAQRAEGDAQAEALKAQAADKRKKAKEVLAQAEVTITDEAVRTASFYYSQLTSIYLELGDTTAAKTSLLASIERAKEDAAYDVKKGQLSMRDQNMYALRNAFYLASRELQDPELGNQAAEAWLRIFHRIDDATPLQQAVDQVAGQYEQVLKNAQRIPERQLQEMDVPSTMGTLVWLYAYKLQQAQAAIQLSRIMQQVAGQDLLNALPADMRDSLRKARQEQPTKQEQPEAMNPMMQRQPSL